MSAGVGSDTAPAAQGDASAVTYRWDLDKTYLRTEFESLRQMVKIPFESAADKVHLPGVPQLIRALRRSAEARGERPYVFFLSASPPQIGAAIREKLALDGIEYDGITFKDQLRNLMRGRFRSLREQVGYKLGELLASRLRGPAAAREVLFGDDWESDPLIYSLYADVIAGALRPEALSRILTSLAVERGALDRALQLAGEVVEAGSADVVARIYINLERRTPPGRFQPFGPRLVPAFNYFQTAASLFEIGLLDAAGLPEVGAALVEQDDSTLEGLRNSLDDLVRRGHLRPETRFAVSRALGRAGMADPGRGERALAARIRAWWQRWRLARPPMPPAVAVDYAEILREWSSRRVRA